MDGTEVHSDMKYIGTKLLKHVATQFAALLGYLSIQRVGVESGFAIKTMSYAVSVLQGGIVAANF